MPYLVEVAVAAPLHETLTYSLPDELEGTVVPGSCVLVPLGRRRVTGYVFGPAPAPEDSVGFQVKPVLRLLAESTFFHPDMVEFYRWIATYYHYPIGEVIRTALPTSPSVKSSRRVKVNSVGNNGLVGTLQTGETPPPWLEKLKTAGELSVEETEAVWKHPASRKVLQRMAREAAVTIETREHREGVSAKLETVIVPGEALRGLITTTAAAHQVCARVEEQRGAPLKRSVKKTLTLWWDAYCTQGCRPVSRPWLAKKYSGVRVALQELSRHQLIELQQQRLYRDPFGEIPLFQPPPATLTDEQQQVLAELLPAVEAGVFHPFLLHGVTGSGKTEVYLQAVQKALDQGLSALVLVPEIALASQLEAQFYSRFGEQLAVLHSGLSRGERYDQWHRIQEGECRVVLGARSAVFAPLNRPGLVIVDEEHEPAYKQDDGLRYSGRDLAVVRGKFAGCPVVLGSATPSLTSFFHASRGKYTLLTMQHRVSDQQLPVVQVVNLRQGPQSRPDLLFSDALMTAMHENFEAGHQTLLFVNRRGYSSFMLCRDCGHVLQCRHCKVSMTLHRDKHQLLCHYCGFALHPLTLCPACGSQGVRGMGMGTERIAREAQEVLPQARIARLDSDTAKNRKQYLAALKEIRSRKVDILVGTQMIAKGLHFPGITLVGVVWADSGLGMPDYKAAERTFTQLSQVTGRAGRGATRGRVFIQTHQPEHHAIACAKHHDYHGFFNEELGQRRSLEYPPVSRMVNIRVSAEEEEAVKITADRVKVLLQRRMPGDPVLLGPAPAPLAVLRGRHRQQLLLKSQHLARLHSACRLVRNEAAKLCAKGVRLHLDVDPENLM